MCIVSYDPGYDIGDRSLTKLTCSDGKNGLMTRFGWKKQSDIPHFPFIGGAPGISWNSPNCGKCWSLEYDGHKIFVLGVDTSTNGFNIGQKAMDALTNGHSVELGRVNAKATAVAAKNCGL